MRSLGIESFGRMRSRSGARGYSASVRSLIATGAFLVLLGCPLPSNVLYRCEPDGTCAAAGFVCGRDTYCRPAGEGVDSGACIPRDVAALCATVDCGFVDDGCGATRECERTCPTSQECGVKEPNRCGFPSLCTSEGWCWEHPLPQGFNLNAALRLDSRHSWLIGENRTVLFFDGERSRLQEVPAPPGVELFAIHGTAPNDVFVVGGNGVTLHFDGARWEREGTLTGFTNPLRTVWSLGDGGALAAGNNGRLMSRAALVDPFSRWTVETFPSTEEIRDVFSDGDGTLYAVTRRNELFARDPARAGDWRRLDTVPLQDTFAGMARAGGLTFGGNAFARGTMVHRDADGGWRELTDAGFSVLEFARAADGGVFAIGSSGFDFGYLDEAENFTHFVVQPGFWNAAAALPGPRLLLAGLAGSTAVVELDGGLSWLSTPRVQRGHSLNALCGASPQAMFAVGGVDNGACPTCKVRWLEREIGLSGAHWLERDFQLGNTSALLTCYAESADRVWLPGNDSKFVFLSAGQATWGDFGGGGLYGQYSGAWGNPDAGYIFTRREASQLTTSAEGVTGFTITDIGGGGGLRSVWGLGANDILVAGINGTTSRYDGTIWTQQYVGVSEELASVHGALTVDGGRRYVAAGNAGTLYSVVNDAGVLAQLSPAVNFSGTWVSTRGTAWAVGKASDGGAYVVRSAPGGSWAVEALSSPRPVTGVFGFDQPDGGATVWLSGPQGMILRKQQ